VNLGWKLAAEIHTRGRCAALRRWFGDVRVEIGATVS